MNVFHFFHARRAVGLMALPLLLAACGEKGKDEPTTPEEMYARAWELNQPNVERDASDAAESMKWLHKAAKAGHLQAQLDLGGIFLEGGKGVRRDGRAAYEWFRRAAAQGSAAAEFFLGYILYHGIDMPCDETLGLAHWRKAAAAGVGEACHRLGLHLTVKDGNLEEGMKWLRCAADDEEPGVAAKAASDLGNLYARGRTGLPKDVAEAVRWYKRGAEGGNARAQFAYAAALMEGEGVEKDTERGMAMLRLSAGQDNPAAIKMLIKELRDSKNAGAYDAEAAAWAERLEQLEQLERMQARKTRRHEGTNGVTH